MRWLKAAAARLRGLFERKRLDRELDDEVRFHLEMQIEENLRAGMDLREARYAALRSFGAIEPIKETYREQRSFSLIETGVRDILHAVRALRNNPGYTATAVAVLALALGGTTAMFSILNAVVLRPLPYKSPEQLVMLWSGNAAKNAREGRTAYWNIQQWRHQSKSFLGIAFFDAVSATLTAADGAEKISGMRTSPNLFELLGVQPLYGRIFTVDEAEKRQPLALISYRFWQTHFAGSFRAIGTAIRVDGVSSRIVGILPRDFRFGDADVWQPYTMYPDWEALRRARGAGFWAAIGRLRPDVTPAQAQVELTVIAQHLDEQLPLAERNGGVHVVPLSLYITGPRPRLVLWMLTGAVFLLLLIATSNVASLSLARGASRQREIAIRVALGASRARIVQQLLAESLTLALVSGLAGLLVAYAANRFILEFKPGNLARLNEASLDPCVLGCALGLCLLTGILSGLTPAIAMARAGLKSSGARAGRGIAAGVVALRVRRALVVTEFGLAAILLVGAGLLVRSFLSVQKVDPGFRAEGVVSIALAPASSTAAAQRGAFYRRVLEEVESIPGVASAGITSELLLSGSAAQVVTAEGDDRPVTERNQLFRSDEVSEGLFQAIGAPLLRGRLFSAVDGPDWPPVAIINETMARQVWHGRDPVGKRFKLGAEDSNRWFTVVGVVSDMHRQGLEKEVIPQMFEPLAQNPPRRAILLARTSLADPIAIAGAVRRAVRRVEKYAPVYGVTTLENQLHGFLTERRFQTSLLIAFSVAALLMAAIGIFGLIQYSIALRTHEIGIRIAVGARRAAIFRMVLGEGLKLSLSGLLAGLLGALWLGRAGSNLLFGITPTDPPTFITVFLLLVGVGIAASYLPARRAMNIEPTAALRHE